MTSTGLSRSCYYVSSCFTSFLGETIGAGFGGGVAAIGYGSKGVDFVTISSCVSVSG